MGNKFKRMSILAPGSSNSPDWKNESDKPEEDNFNDVFADLNKLEADSKIFEKISPRASQSPATTLDPNSEVVEVESSNQDEVSEKDMAQSDTISQIKLKYDQEIKKLKKQGKNPMIKGLIKNLKKERDQEIEEVKRAE